MRLGLWTIGITAARLLATPALAGAQNPNAHSATEPSISRDGKLIAFTSDRGGAEDIYVMNADGSNVRRMTATPEAEHYPVWSPDGTRIAFFGSPGGKGGIYVMSADGSNRKLIAATQTAADNPNRPTWSPDGKRLAFVVGAEGNDQIILANVDGSGTTPMPGARVGDGMPAWSPTGESIAFVTRRSGNADILVGAVNGAGLRRLTGSQVDEMNPTWSGDGSRIAYLAEGVGDHNFDVFVASVDDPRSPTNVSANPDWEAYPEWSAADPNVILEVKLRDGVVGIYAIDLRGGSAKWLTGPSRP